MFKFSPTIIVINLIQNGLELIEILIKNRMKSMQKLKLRNKQKL